MEICGLIGPIFRFEFASFAATKMHLFVLMSAQTQLNNGSGSPLKDNKLIIFFSLWKERTNNSNANMYMKQFGEQILMHEKNTRMLSS